MMIKITEGPNPYTVPLFETKYFTSKDKSEIVQDKQLGNFKGS